MSALIARDQPILICEVSDAYLRQVAGSAKEVLTLLHQRGYQVFSIDDGFFEIRPDDAFQKQFNVLALPRRDKVPQPETR